MTRAMEIDVEPLRAIELDTSLDEDGFDVFTEFQGGADAERIDPYPEYARRRAEEPVRRVPDDERPALIGFLASDEGAFCTGGDYLIDGALTAHIGV